MYKRPIIWQGNEVITCKLCKEQTRHVWVSRESEKPDVYDTEQSGLCLDCCIWIYEVPFERFRQHEQEEYAALTRMIYDFQILNTTPLTWEDVTIKGTWEI